MAQSDAKRIQGVRKGTIQSTKVSSEAVVTERKGEGKHNLQNTVNANNGPPDRVLGEKEHGKPRSCF